MNRFIFILFLCGVLISPFTTFLPLGINVSLFDMVLIVCFILVFITNAMSFKVDKNLAISVPSLLLFSFFMGALISSFNADSTVVSTMIIVQYLFAIIVLKTTSAHLLKNSTNSEKTILSIIDFYVYGLLIVLFIGASAGLGLLPGSNSLFAGNGRLISVQGNANTLAKYLVCSLPILLFYIDVKRKLILAYAALALMIYNLFLTSSFGGIAYFALTFLAYYILKAIFITKPIKLKKRDILINKKLFNFRIAALFVLAATLVIYIFANPPEVFSDRVLAADDLDDAGSFQLKFALMEEAVTLILTKHSLIGMGLGDYPTNSFYGTNVHNWYLLVFAETGIFGFLGLIGLFVYVLISGFRIIGKLDITNKYIMLGLLVSIIGLMISITTTPHMYARNSWLLVMLALSYAEYLKKKIKKSEVA